MLLKEVEWRSGQLETNLRTQIGNSRAKVIALNEKLKKAKSDLRQTKEALREARSELSAIHRSIMVDDPNIDTTSRTGKLIMGILALIAEFENDIRRERQMDGISKARDRGVRFGRKPLLVAETTQQVKKLRKAGKTVPEIMRQTSLSKASVYRALTQIN